MMVSVAKNHYTATELASMNLPGMPATKVGVRTKAERECWSYVQTTGMGGTRREYAPPADVVEAIKVRAAQQLVAAVPPCTLPQPARRPGHTACVSAPGACCGFAARRAPRNLSPCCLMPARMTRQ